MPPKYFLSDPLTDLLFEPTFNQYPVKTPMLPYFRTGNPAFTAEFVQ